MICLKCGTENPQEAKFCMNCTFPLEQTADLDQSGRLQTLQRSAPRGLQEKIRTVGSELEGERKPVTILFADIVGSTAKAEKLDPEEWKEVVAGAHRRVSEAIYRYEGTIAQLLGDGVLAFFGAPITHEDDPIRAVHAALNIQESIGEYGRELAGYVDDFEMRIGINTGEVVIGDIGTDLHMEYLAIGDAVNVAARVESAAQPGCVLLSEDSARLVGGVFELNDLGQIEAKGKADPIRVYEVESVKTEPEGRLRVEGAHSPYVGRSGELDQLKTALAALCKGHGQVAFVLGEAGIGKSRLVEEAQTQAADEFELTKKELERGTLLVQPSSLRWLEGRALSYGASLSYWTVTQLLLADLGLTDGAPEAKIKVALGRRAKTLLTKKTDEVLPYLSHLLGLKLNEETEEKIRNLDGETLKRETMTSIQAYFTAVAKEQPTVLVFEDLHWADPSSLEVLEYMLTVTDRAPLMILGLMRVERDHGSWEVKQQAESDLGHRFTELHLRSFNEDESTEMVNQLLGIVELPREIRELILVRSAGNPFYLEEVIHHLRERKMIVQDDGGWHAVEGIAEIGIPDTLQGVLLARIDRLEEDVRGTLQMASVIGKSFLYRLLEAISEAERQLEEHLSQLQRVDLVREKTLLPELEYMFKHSLTQEAAYNSLLQGKRREFHLKVGEALESLFPDRTDEFLGLLAHHFEAAEEHEKAVDYLIKAGDQAREVYANKEAARYYEGALDFLRDQGAHHRATRTLMKLGLVHHTTLDFERSRQAYQEGFALWHQAGASEPAEPLSPAPHPFRVPWVNPLTLDPIMALDEGSGNVIAHLFSGLVELTPELEIVPDVAKSWEVMDVGRKYVFHLRDDVLWSDGAPVTAGDFEFAWKRVLDPTNVSGFSSFFDDIKGASAYHSGEDHNPDHIGVRAVDDHTLSVELERPAGFFLHVLTLAYPVPRHTVELHGSSWSEPGNIVTNGPFLLESWKQDDRLILTRNPEYHGGFGGNLQQVEFLIKEYWSESLGLYESGEMDLKDSKNPADKDRAIQRHGSEYLSAPHAYTEYVGFNLHQPPFNDRRVRQAFTHALDRARIADIVRHGYSSPATGGFVPPGIPGHASDIGLKFDPDLARRLLAEAGYPGGEGFPVDHLVYNLERKQDPTIRDVLSQWKNNLGVTIKERTIKWDDYFEILREKEVPPLYRMGWLADYPDPDSFLRLGLIQIRFQSWSKVFDDLIDRARSVTDQADRMSIYQEADRLLINEATLIPLWYGRKHFLLKPWVRRFRPSPVRFLYLKEVILEDH